MQNYLLIWHKEQGAYTNLVLLETQAKSSWGTKLDFVQVRLDNVSDTFKSWNIFNSHKMKSWIKYAVWNIGMKFTPNDVVSSQTFENNR